MRAFVCLVEANDLSPFGELQKILDSIATNGCSGLLMWRGEDSQNAVESLSTFEYAIRQIIGLSFKPRGVNASQQRYGEMKIELISPRAMLLAHSKEDGFQAEHLSDTFDLSSTITSLESKLTTTLTSDVLILHIPLTQDVPKELQNRYAELASAMLQYSSVENSKDIYTVAIQSNDFKFYDVHNLAGKSQPIEDSYMPIQSYQVYEGRAVTISSFQPAIVSYYMPNITRRDRCTAFDVEHAAKLGANSKLLVDQFLPEIAFKLGFTPKYGA
eukprot:TRINITY_DN3538_c0_g1_i6.p1 TRINITY_DN3538_c0_g1~~TRINITY_DN3538_c0_g1_i6.p1  ORF type:complete len:272 (+),score=48.08 TRINITY_DN3538_c0_g1_i6:51-866(+)